MADTSEGVKINESVNTRMNPPRKIETNVKDRQMPGSPPGILRPPAPPMPAYPVGIQRKPNVEFTVSPGPAQRAIVPGTSNIPGPPPRPTEPPPVVGWGAPLQPDVPHPPKILAAQPLIQRPPRPVDLEGKSGLPGTNPVHSDASEPKKTVSGVCADCNDTKVVDVKKNKSGVIYEFRRCPSC